jgi:uncharacterized protein
LDSARISVLTFYMAEAGYRKAIADYILTQANPPDKFSHQPRLYRLAVSLAGSEPFDDDVVYAAAWMHDLGVFVGHRPEELSSLAAWDHVAYAERETPGVLRRVGFPAEKIPAVLEVMRTHLPSANPTTFEGVLLRDADLLEQLGAIAILRTVSKVGRDTRFVRFDDALRVLRRNADQLAAQLRLPAARKAAGPRLKVLNEFLDAAQVEADGIPF